MEEENLTWEKSSENLGDQYSSLARKKLSKGDNAAAFYFAELAVEFYSIVPDKKQKSEENAAYKIIDIKKSVMDEVDDLMDIELEHNSKLLYPSHIGYNHPLLRSALLAVYSPIFKQYLEYRKDPLKIQFDSGDLRLI